MGFTAAMDDFDEARYAQGPSPLHVSPVRPRHGERAAGERAESAPSWLREEEDVVETVLPPQGTGAPVRVKGLSAAGRIQVRAEMQLLAALEVAGVVAVPGILSIEDDGYVRENAPSLTRRGGRRAAEIGTPATAERAGTRRARDQLDAMVDALHERGWVLGAASGQGVGLREDGTVVVLDLRGLMPHDDLAACRADRRWVDSVLADGERTLRRRIQEPLAPGPCGDGIQDRAGVMAGAIAGSMAGVMAAPMPGTMPGTMAGTMAGEPAGGGDSGSPRPDREHRGAEPQEPALVRSLLAAPASDPSPSTRPLAGPMARGRELLTARGTRRTALATAAAVLLGGTVLGTGTWLAMPSTGKQPGEQVTASAAAVAPAPPIDDAWELAAELAGARHAYVTGLSAQPVAAAGSDAMETDIGVRAAYDGVTVEGGGPVIHEAEVLEGPTDEGTALLRIITSSEAAELVAADGTRRPVAATPRTSIELEISWDGAGWRVESTTPTTSPGVG